MATFHHSETAGPNFSNILLPSDLPLVSNQKMELCLYMSPISPVFYTVVTVSWSQR